MESSQLLRHGVLTLILAVILIPLTQYYGQRSIEDVKRLAEYQLQTYQYKLERELSHAFLLVEHMHTPILQDLSRQNTLTPHTIEMLKASVASHSTSIAGLRLEHNNRIETLWPVGKNESWPSAPPDLETVLEQRLAQYPSPLTLTPPFTLGESPVLRMEGITTIRQPVSGELLGYLRVSLNLSAILNEINLPLHLEQLQLALSYGPGGALFFGLMPLPLDDAAKAVLKLPDGEKIILSAAPPEGWPITVRPAVFRFVAVGLIFIVLLNLLLHQSTRSHQRLMTLVTKRTRSLQEKTLQLVQQQERLNAIYAAYPDNQFIVRNDGTILEHLVTPEGGLAYPTQKLIGQPIHSIMPAHMEQACQQALHNTAATGTTVHLEYKEESTADHRFVEARIVRLNNQELVVICRDISKRKQTEQQLVDSELRFRRLFERSPVGICLLDNSGQLVSANPALCEIFGYREKQFMRLRRDQLFTPKSLSALELGLADLRRGKALNTTVKAIHRQGHHLYLELQAEQVLLQNEPYTYALVLDVTERVTNELILQQHASVFANTREGILITDAQRRIISVNPAFTLITGYSEQDVIGKTPGVLGSSQSDDDFFRRMWKEIAEHDHWQGVIWNTAKDGREYPEWLTISAIKDSNNIIRNYVGVFSDITSIKESEERLRYQAHHDTLTELPNRLLLELRLEHALSKAARHHSKLALLFIDLDKFKQINDTLGHEAGDQVLIEVARRLKVSVRAEDTVARLGGDEFVILMEDIHHPDEAAILSNKLLEILNEDYLLEDGLHAISASIGISLYPESGTDASELIHNADTAMYRAKGQSHGGFRYYSNDLSRHADSHIKMTNTVKQALDNDDIQLVYQPEVRLDNHQICTVEALMRLKHNRVQIKPKGFLPGVQGNDLINELGERVLSLAIAQAAHWSQDNQPPTRVSINLSQRQLTRRDLPVLITRLLQAHHCAPQQIELEIPEHFVIQHNSFARQQLTNLHQLGISIVLDDFGYHYGAVNGLCLGTFDKVKFARKLIEQIGHSPQGEILLQSLIELAARLHISSVAVGVEHSEQLLFLQKNGCGAAQGYLLCPPRPADKIQSRLPVH